jgi:hypothetical protein
MSRNCAVAEVARRCSRSRQTSGHFRSRRNSRKFHYWNYFFFTGASFFDACDCEHCGCTPVAEYDRLPQCGQIAPGKGAASKGAGFFPCEETMGGLSES